MHLEYSCRLYEQEDNSIERAHIPLDPDFFCSKLEEWKKSYTTKTDSVIWEDYKIELPIVDVHF